jgi:hypothetical protein
VSVELRIRPRWRRLPYVWRLWRTCRRQHIDIVATGRLMVVLFGWSPR